jgi:hypothetical protein
MDLEQKLEGPWAWGFAIVICLLIVGAMFVGASFNHPMVPPPVEAESAGIAATQGAPPTPASAAQSGVPSGNAPESAGLTGRGSAGTAVHAGTANLGPGNMTAPSTGVPNPAAGAGSGSR